MTNSTLTTLYADVEEILLEKEASKETRRLELQRISAELIVLIKAKPLHCQKCQATSPFGEWSFIQNHWYTPPTGCSRGDYWNENEKNTCHIICPCCDKQNYIHNHPQREEILLYLEKTELTTNQVFSKIYTSYADNGKLGTLKQVYPRLSN